ncbi:MAG: thiosulfate oxidation carrier protein SoxY, partial [Burkholderiaceae bacterium]
LILQAPEIAENGNVVRIGAQSNIPGTTQVAFVIEKNPYALTAVFDIPPGTDASVATNVKMGQSSNVYALAKAGDKYFYAVKEVKVTLGGCGG